MSKRTVTTGTRPSLYSGVCFFLGMLARTAICLALAAGLFGAGGEPIYDQAMGDPSEGRPGLILPKLDRDAFPDCVAPDRFEGIPSSTVVVTQAGDVRLMGFDKAWNLGQNDEQADNVWVIGACA